MDIYALATIHRGQVYHKATFVGPKAPTASDFVHAFEALGELKRNVMWHIGDLIVECERVTGERSAELVSACGLSVSELEDAVRLSERWAPDERDYSLPWSYYRDAGIDKALAVPLLVAAARNDWSRDQLRAAKKAVEAKIELSELEVK